MGNVEIPSWLEGLPLAPVFRPTDTEFADPIAYISKIEKEASAFGICKIVPPLPKPSKKYVLGNLNKSLAKCPELGPDANLASARSLGKPGCRDNCIDGETKAVFTTRQQELGQSVKKPKGAGDNVHLGAQKQVWQSGEMYTLEQFEAKSKAFARSQLGMVKEVSAEVVEAMFWQAASEKPIYVEYANDVPGSGFGEQDGQLRYFHRRRRMRMDYLRQKKGSDGKNSEVGATNDSHGHGGETNVSCVGNHSSSETCKASMSQTGTLAEETSRPYHKSNSSNYELEGTAGWKLSNSPWNLQVIARSSGSLTRFMPDDIPGVTSPMVYIGMLFSWFAWHVEDHELHSMNFLHMGSPKTWYAVPGDYAYAFEEIIRKEAYGGSIDRLAALSLLGEKTTLLSPEVIVAAGIPCCRLIQNPGEFVVTFPRAYHIGFSHGFNCGEAANFATPQWLRFAKEAAVRRAAMNYLPMLSHQQLLYLLTMSFVARVPRSLIPGARTSRLRDRQREERELSVKKAFLEDILNENDLLLSLLGKKSTSRAVIWNPHLLPSQNKESRLPDGTVVSTSVGENLAQKYSEHANSSINLFKEMTMYMEALNGSYMDTDDLLFDFQVDSGTLACVACGILGFPFMSVIQPLDTASAAFLNTDHPPLQTCDDQQNVSDPASPPKQLPERSSDNSGKSFSTSDGLLRPRIFCLEHAIQIENILQSKGGANVLVICHSDYQKMKVYARSIAEEIGLPFVYKEIPLDTAAEEDLKLIDLAIDDHDSVGCRDDWTTKLGINLQYCVKARKNSLLSRVQHALTLGGLISDESPGSTILNVKWKSRKSRSKSRIGNPEKCKPHEHLQMKDETISGGKWDIDTVKKEDRIIQYTRRNAKFKPGIAIGNSRVQGRTRKQPAAEVSLATDGEGYSYAKMQSEVGFDGTLDESRHEIQVLEAVGGLSLDLLPPQIARSPVGVTPYVGNVDVQVISEAPEKMDVETKAFSFSAGNTCERQREIELSHRPAEKNESLIDDDSCFADTAAGENLGLLRANGTAEAPFYNTLDLEAARVLRASSPPIGLHNEITLNCKVQDETPSSKVKESDNLRGSLIAHTEVTQHTASAELPESEACKIMCSKQDSSHNPLLDARNATQTGNENSEKKPTSQLSARMEANIEVAKDLTQNPKVQPETERLDEHGEKDVSIPMEETRLICSSVEECSEARTYSGEHMNKDGNLEGEIQRKNQIADQISDDNPALSSVTATTDFDQECSLLHRELNDSEDSRSADENSSSGDIMNCETMKAAVVNQSIGTGKKRKRKSEMEMVSGHFLHYSSFVRSPCEGLRPRAAKQAVKGSDDCIIKLREEKPPKKPREPRRETASSGDGGERTSTSHRCDIEGCRMKFKSKADLLMHKRNRCPVEGCRKKFRSHKYAILHQRVHDDDRPLKCPWKGCNMTFKWAWARTEHIRVHTGERPYKCKVEGCGLSFRFVSDFSRHRRKTGHYVS